MNVLQLRRLFRMTEKKLTRADKKDTYEYFNDDYVFWLEDELLKYKK